MDWWTGGELVVVERSNAKRAQRTSRYRAGQSYLTQLKLRSIFPSYTSDALLRPYLTVPLQGDRPLLTFPH